MADIRYVIVSDLHFGAENSMLTALREGPATSTDTGFLAEPQQASPVLTGLVSGLRELTRGQDRPPELILAGDILDLALSPDETAMMVYRLFAHLAYEDGQPVFAPVMHYVPGNHDHHEWEIAREGQYSTYAVSQPAQAPLDAPWHTTKLAPGDERPTASSPLLTGLTRVQAGYPQRRYASRGVGIEDGAAASVTQFFDTAITGQGETLDVALRAFLRDNPAADHVAIREFMAAHGAGGGEYVSEDFMFCRLVRAMGLTLWSCPWMPLTHIGSFAYSSDLRAYLGDAPVG